MIPIKATKSTIIEKYLSKKPCEVFEEYVSAELRVMIRTEANMFAAQKNSTFVLSIVDLNTFHAILIMTGYHSLLGTRLY